MAHSDSQLLLTFYGDDFTGSTDSMEALAKAGIQVALFIDPPKTTELDGAFAHLQAIGVAGISRSLASEDMQSELEPIFQSLKQLNAKACHYKLCSTFDSSPQAGSIGQAAEIGLQVFDANYAPMLVGAPILKRYVLFGHLFATVSNKTIRLDRHPTMSQHPITPMNESDLGIHLSKQTNKKIANCDILSVRSADNLLDTIRAQSQEHDIIIFDSLEDRDLALIGEALWRELQEKKLFLMGSSGVEYALAMHWQKIGLCNPQVFPKAAELEQLLVMSGSASPVTAAQINWAKAHHYSTVRINTADLIDPQSTELEQERLKKLASDILNEGKSPLLFTACGPDDAALNDSKQRNAQLGLDQQTLGQRIAEAQGHILKDLIESHQLSRVCVTGGDSSGHIARSLGIEALEICTPIAPGGPLCRALAPGTAMDGLEIALKGGQVGPEDYFDMIRRGHA